MAIYSNSDKQLLNNALSELLQEAGIREGTFANLFQDLFNGTTDNITLYVNSGTGHSTAIALQRGARAEIGSASTITGTTEVTLDGTATTLAAMRAASPKLVTNTYGTIIYE
jgi:hypothetical protein